MKKMVKFTNKKTNEVNNIGTYNVGQYMFAIVGSVDETNKAIRFCNKAKVGEVYETDDVKIEVIQEGE